MNLEQEIDAILINGLISKETVLVVPCRLRSKTPNFGIKQLDQGPIITPTVKRKKHNHLKVVIV